MFPGKRHSWLFLVKLGNRGGKDLLEMRGKTYASDRHFKWTQGLIQTSPYFGDAGLEICRGYGEEEETRFTHPM